MRLNLLCLLILLWLNYFSDVSARLRMKPYKRFRIKNRWHRSRRAVSYGSSDHGIISYPYPFSGLDWTYHPDYRFNPIYPTSSSLTYLPENIFSSYAIPRMDETDNEYEDRTETSETPYYYTEEESVTEAPVTTTTTPEPWDVNDIKVPTRFLRIEYMTSFVFLGLWYGLGFLVMFQSLVVPATKLVLVGVYYVLTKYAGAPQWNVQDALDQLPPD